MKLSAIGLDSLTFRKKKNIKYFVNDTFFRMKIINAFDDKWFFASANERTSYLDSKIIMKLLPD